jgi:predicted HicB family RNase H-like nuclease
MALSEAFSFSISKLHHRKLKKMAKALEISMSEWLKRMIDQKWDEFEKRVKHGYST